MSIMNLLLTESTESTDVTSRDVTSLQTDQVSQTNGPMDQTRHDKQCTILVILIILYYIYYSILHTNTNQLIFAITITIIVGVGLIDYRPIDFTVYRQYHLIVSPYHRIML